MLVLVMVAVAMLCCAGHATAPHHRHGLRAEACARQGGDKPHIVFVLLDDVGYTNLGFMGASGVRAMRERL